MLAEVHAALTAGHLGNEENWPWIFQQGNSLLAFYLKTTLKMGQETSTEQGIGIQSKHSYQSPHLAFLITAVSPCADSHAQNNSHLKQSKANFSLSPPWLCYTSYFPSKRNKTLWQDLSAPW